MVEVHADRRAWLIRTGWTPTGEGWSSRAFPGEVFSFDQAWAHYEAATDGLQFARHLRVGDVIRVIGIKPLTVEVVQVLGELELVRLEARADGRLFSRIFPTEQMLDIERPSCSLV